MLSSDESDNEDYPPFDSSITFINLDYHKRTKQEELEKSENFYNLMEKRRSVTSFSGEEVSLDVLKNIIKTAGILWKKEKLFNSEKVFY